MVAALVTWLIYLVALLAASWVAGAIYYDVGKSSRTGLTLAVVWMGLAVGALAIWRPSWQPLVMLAASIGVFLVWWFSLRPSSERPWDQDFTHVPRASLAGDTVTIEGLRNTDYGASGDRTTRFEMREYRLSELRGVDVLILFWGSPWMCHPMFIFDFGPDGRVCISIEVRYRIGQKFSLLRSLYRQQELTYVVCDERDAILRRTKYMKGHELYLYRFDVGAITMRRFFLEYAMSVNALAAQPRWYHGLTTNCTTSIYLQGRSHMKWDWRMYLNGSLDRLLYKRQFLDQTLPFAELKRQSRVNDVANAAPVDGFGEYIRSHLSGYRSSVDHSSPKQELLGANHGERG